ncbi:MAG: C45 family peptidase [Alistipes sp.]
MKIVIKIFVYTLLGVLGLLLIAFGIGCFLYQTADLTPPTPIHNFADSTVWRLADGSRAFGTSRLRQSRNGFWELWIEGDAEQRGAAFGALADSLIYQQEAAFVDQIRNFIPNERYLGLLRYLTFIFNRRLSQHIPAEYCSEIAAISRNCSHEFDFIGEPYLRQLNYHAAHDIGHAMQGYMLVGCTSFGAWGDAAAGQMLIGRNFDFYVGDEFARNRLLMFCKPDKGYGFVSIGWPGMVGVLSGMNEVGLTITLNSAKGPIPLSSATPVSILARQILQYAATIDEAVAIASKYHLFVSESFLIGSARDGKCAVIEKTPKEQSLYTVATQIIGSTNHFQSEAFADDRYNRENIASSDSKPRADRLEELLRQNTPLTVEKAVNILRDRCHYGGMDLGLSNPLAINQQIAHHSVVFLPQQLRMWVSTSYWGYGTWVCYDIGQILQGNRPFEGELCDPDMMLPADSLFLRESLPNLLRYRRLRHCLTGDTIDSLATTNPFNWETFVMIGRYYELHRKETEAQAAFNRALNLPMPEGERKQLENKFKKR